MKKVIAALIGFAAIAFSQSAIAQTANRDANNNIIVSETGLTAGTLVKVWYPGAVDKATLTASGPCNLLTVKKSDKLNYRAFIKVNGTSLSTTILGLPILTAPACVNGVANPAYTWITTGGYKYVQSTDKTFILTPSPGQFAIETDQGNHRLAAVDKCGRISIKNSEKWPIAGVNFGDNTFSYIVNGSYGPDIPIPATVSVAMPICYKGKLYRPLNP